MCLDTEANRLDVARIAREARSRGANAVRWGSTQIQLGEDALVIAGRVIELERQVVRPPNSDQVVEGPVLAICPRPGCHRRARVLWALPGNETDLACRACTGVRYASASTSDEAERARLAFERLRAKLAVSGGSPLPRRPRQHAVTHSRGQRRLAEARARVESATSANLRRTFGVPPHPAEVGAKVPQVGDGVHHAPIGSR